MFNSLAQNAAEAYAEANERKGSTVEGDDIA